MPASDHHNHDLQVKVLHYESLCWSETAGFCDWLKLGDLCLKLCAPKRAVHCYQSSAGQAAGLLRVCRPLEKAPATVDVADPRSRQDIVV